MNSNRFILSDEETLHLLTGFFHEALRFLRVPQEKYPQITIGVGTCCDGKIDPIYINYRKNKILFFIPFFRLLIASNPRNTNDCPTVYRTYGYKLAYIWHIYITTGKESVFMKDTPSTLFASALQVIKGVPLQHRIIDESQEQLLKSVLGFSPNDRGPILKMLKEEFGMACQVRRGFDIATQKIGEFISFTQEESKRRATEILQLYNESVRNVLPYINEGALGSESNPFRNIDEAADYILGVEKEWLQKDRYRQLINDEQYFYDYNNDFFRISWASPNVGYYHLENATYPCFTINQLELRPEEGGKLMPRFSIKPSLRHNKFLYRGQAEFFSPCKPSMFRDKKKTYFVDDIIQTNELKCLLKTHPLVRLFEQGFKLLHEHIRFKINYKGLAQHYYNNTELLDLTSDIEVAKFFAVTTFDMDNDRYVKYEGDKLGVLYYFDIKPNSFSDTKEKSYIIDAIGKQPFMRSGNQSGFLINMNKGDDFNKYPEVRYVFFRHDLAITDRIFAQFDNGNKIMPDEILRRHWHARMNDEKAKKIVSAEAVKLNFAYNTHESHNKILKALQQKGFKIKSYHPSFTEEELDIYYQTVPQFWEEFCSNVYFYGPEGFLLKKHLQNLPNDSRYRWAFYR